MPILSGPPTYLQSTLPPGWRFGYQSVAIGPVTWGLVDAWQVEWHAETFDGWEDSPETVQVVTKRPDDHGSDVGPQVLDARMVTLNGWIIAPSHAEREAAAQRLRIALQVGATVDLVVSGLPDKTARCRRQGPIKMRPVLDTAYQVQWSAICPDPLRYSVDPESLMLSAPAYDGGIDLPNDLPFDLPVRESSGYATVINAGDMPSGWTCRVYGPCSAPRLTNITTDRWLGVDITLAAGEYIDIDTRDRSVMLAGIADRTGLMRYGSSWWKLQPGEIGQQVAFTSGTGGNPPPALFTPYSAWS